MKIRTMKKPPRLNFDIPRELVNEVRYVANCKGLEPSQWLRKMVEKAITEAHKEINNADNQQAA